MSFIGAINEKLRKFFFTYADRLEGRRCYIGCSGNFTVEQLISRRCLNAELYSNDVSLYSSVIGTQLMGKPLRLEIVNPELSWASEYLERYPIAAMLLILEMLKYEKRKNPYSERMWEAYKATFDNLLVRTIIKVKKATDNIRIKEYTAIDVHDYYPRPDGVSIGFLPTYVGGYEKLFARLEESVKWEKPSYQMLTDERREETIRRMTQGEFILYDDRERDLPCVARVEQFGHKTVQIYSNLDMKKGVFRREFNEKVVKFNLLEPEDEIPTGTEIRIAKADMNAVNHYRNMFLSKMIQPGSGGPCYLAFAKDKLFGCLIFQAYSRKGGGAQDEIYLLSDFVVPSVRHKRLAKLLLLSALSAEMRRELCEGQLRDYKSILTTAFTDKPVSMKYRGVFELSKRGKGFLNYRGKFEEHTLKEVVTIWMKKYEKQ